MSSAWITALSSLVVAVLALLGWAGRTVWRVCSRVSRFLDDFFGEPARTGVPVRPGVMARLQMLEQRIFEVQAETKPNGGSSMRDVVHRTAHDVAVIKNTQQAMQDTQKAMQRRMEQIEQERRQEGPSRG